MEHQTYPGSIVTEKPLTDTTGAAAILCVDPQSLANWRVNGRVAIPYIKIGRVVRYRIADLNAFIEQNRKLLEA
jgi:hypothetical protein